MQRRNVPTGNDKRTPAQKMAKNMTIFAFVTCLLVIGVIYVFYQHKNADKVESGNMPSATELQKLTEKDLEMGYPETPTEVVKFFARINQYIEDINRMMSQLSGGNFDVEASVPFIGDFRSISESVDSFTASLSSAMNNINDVEHKVFGHAQSLSNSSQMLAEGATDQAAAVEELTATTEDLARSAEKNIQMATEMRDNAHMTGAQVNLSSQQMEQLISAMTDISDTSQQIENIISTIENIAFQTNILALNAAVEASRAGEAGKGFAVVAKEVRDLAAKSDQAAKATKELIENSVQAAGRGSRIVEEVSTSLKKTLTLVTKSNDAVEEFADAVQIEATAISQVSEALGQISNVVQTNTANSEESAAVSAELFEQVNQMQKQTSRFRLKH